MYLIAGLGNPGPKYRKTRHNVGFMVLDLLAERQRGSFDSFKGSSLVCSTQIAGQEVLLAKPQTYMNLSGRAVRELARFRSVPFENCLIVYDEVSLPLGSIRIRKAGSAGGHNGMRSIIETVGTQDVPRLRIGIGPDHPVDNLSKYVLGNFRFSERKPLQEVLELGVSAVEAFVAEGIDSAMRAFNSKNVEG